MESKPYEFVIIEMLDQILNELKELNKGNKKIRIADLGIEEQLGEEENNTTDEIDKFIETLYKGAESAEKVEQLEKEVESLKEELSVKTIKDHVLEQITFKLMAQTIKELNIDQKLSVLAVNILEEKNEEMKQDLMKQYEKIKKLDNLLINQISEEDLDYTAQRKLNEKISQLFRDDERLSKDLAEQINKKLSKNWLLTY